MTLSELTTYARDRYDMEEDWGRSEFPGCSLLADPRTGAWCALLIRGWDGDLGEELEYCDLKCGPGPLPPGGVPGKTPADAGPPLGGGAPGGGHPQGGGAAAV